MQCPSCGANLEVENELDSFFCKYCGTKIYVTEQDPEIIKAKTSIKLAKEKAELEKVKLQQELDIKKVKLQQELDIKKQENKDGTTIGLLIIGIIFLMYLFIYLLIQSI